MSDLNELAKLVVVLRDDRNWKQFHKPKDMTLSLVLEAAELMEHFQWKDTGEMAKHLKEHKSDVAEELADILYWVLLISNDFEIDLSNALKTKLQEISDKYPVEKAKNKHSKYTEL